MHLRTQRFIAALVLLAVAVALPVVDATPSEAATRLSVSPARPIPREYVKIGSKFGTAFRRPVRLQYWTGSRWATLAQKSTTSTGRFTFTTRGPARARKYRAEAPRVVRNGRAYATLLTAARTVRPARQTARLTFVPAQIGQAKSGTQNLTPGTAVFRPIRQGRKVALQKYVSGSWKTVSSGVQNGRGTFAFNAAARNGQAFRAVTLAAKGAPAKRSATVKAVLPRPTFNDNFNTFDATKWSYRLTGANKRSANNRQCSESSSKSVRVRYGKLELQTKEILPTYRTETVDPNPLLPGDEYQRRVETNPDYDENTRDCPDGQFYNGHIGTEGKFDFRHGIMAARMKMQPSQGHHGGFWSQPMGSPSIGAEIDAVEYYGDSYVYKGRERMPIQHSIYRLGEMKAKVVKNRSYLLRSGRTWSSDYHVFSVQWTPSVYIFRVDGVETFRTARAVSQTDQAVILSLLSSEYETASNKPSSAPMHVDWVRVWD